MINTDNTADYIHQTAAAVENGEWDKAQQLAGEFVKDYPENFDAQQLAGVVAFTLGHAKAAFEHFSKATQLASNPTLAAAAWCGIGQVHLLQETSPQHAEAAFYRALSLVNEFPQALAGLAEAFNRQSRWQEAEKIAIRAKELGVREARLETTLGYALMGQDRIDEALQAFERGLSLEPDSYELQVGIATVAVNRGDFETSERIYRDIMSKLPRFPIYERISTLKKFSNGDPDIVLMEQRLSELPDDAPSPVRSDLHFALAKAYDDIEDTKRASHHLQKGNELEKEGVVFDPERENEQAERIEQLVTKQFIQRYSGSGAADIKPIFIVSLPRSGSTLTEQMLASHSRIHGGGELGYIARLAIALGEKWINRPNYPDMAVDEVHADLREAGHEYAQQTAKFRLLQSHFTDKSLGNHRYIGLIPLLLPDAKILHLRRHPLAVALGLYRMRFASGIAYSNDLEHISHHYKAYARIMDHWRRTAPDAFIDIYYEALVENPERELRRIFDYVGLDFEPGCLEFYKLKRPVRTASVVQVRKPLDHTRLTRHERYQELLEPAANSLAEEISRYESELHAHLAKS